MEITGLLGRQALLLQRGAVRRLAYEAPTAAFSAPIWLPVLVG